MSGAHRTHVGSGRAVVGRHDLHATRKYQVLVGGMARIFPAIPVPHPAYFAVYADYAVSAVKTETADLYLFG